MNRDSSQMSLSRNYPGICLSTPELMAEGGLYRSSPKQADSTCHSTAELVGDILGLIPRPKQEIEDFDEDL